MIIVPKKTEKLWICINNRKLDRIIKTDPFLLPFINEIFETMAKHELHFILDRFSGYN